MQHLGLAFTVATLLTNVWGLALLTGFYWRDRWFALAAGPWLWTALMFAIECQWGLGKLQSLGAFTTVASLGLIGFCQSRWEPVGWSERRLSALRAWRAEFAWNASRGCQLVFAGLFAYAFAWRFAFPDLNIWVEKIPDLSFIASYAAGTRIPVPDVWLSPFPSNHYYSFQHYAAALLGRLLGMGPGLSYNLGFCLLIALAGAAFTGVVVRLARRAVVRTAIVAAFVVGGTGVTLIAPFVLTECHPWDGVFLFGKVAMDKAPLGPLLQSYADGFKKLSLPTEPFAYSVYLGDFHAPLSSYCLLGLGMMGAILWQQTRQARYVPVVGAALTWTVLSNVWTLPLQAFATLAWVVSHRNDWRRLTALLCAGAAVVWLSAWPYLSTYSSFSGRQDLSFRWVPSDEHTPPLFFVISLFPTLLLLAAALFSANRDCRRLAWLWLACLLFTELVFVDDSYANIDNRFNSTLKWWPWITAAALLTTGPLALEAGRRRVVVGVAWVACLLPCAYAWTLGQYWWYGDKPARGHMEGHYFMTRDPVVRMLYERLRVEPPSLVIENPLDKDGVGMASLSLHAGHRLWLGWDGYELLWRGFPESIRPRQARLVAFYKAALDTPLEFLVSEKIDLVIWYRENETISQWESIDKAINARYQWCEIHTAGDRKAGFWKLRRASLVAEGMKRREHENK